MPLLSFIFNTRDARLLLKIREKIYSLKAKSVWQKLARKRLQDTTLFMRIFPMRNVYPWIQNPLISALKKMLFVKIFS